MQQRILKTSFEGRTKIAGQVAQPGGGFFVAKGEAILQGQH